MVQQPSYQHKDKSDTLRVTEWEEKEVPESYGIIDLPYHPWNHLLLDFLIQRTIISVGFLLYAAKYNSELSL